MTTISSEQLNTIESAEPLSTEHDEIGAASVTSTDAVTSDTAYYGPCAKCTQVHGGWEECPERPPAGDIITAAYDAIDEVEVYAAGLAEATRTETSLEDGRAVAKSAAILRLMETMNAETGKLHSASSAEKMVESDAQYMVYRKQQGQAVVERIQADGAYKAAQLRGQLAVALVSLSKAGQ